MRPDGDIAFVASPADVGEGGFRVGGDAEIARKMAFTLRLLDGEGMSPNLAAAFAELGSTISSWPQLAGDVVLGGASGLWNRKLNLLRRRPVRVLSVS